jgi:hypothetical protein
MHRVDVDSPGDAAADGHARASDVHQTRTVECALRGDLDRVPRVHPHVAESSKEAVASVAGENPSVLSGPQFVERHRTK